MRPATRLLLLAVIGLAGHPVSADEPPSPAPPPAPAPAGKPAAPQTPEQAADAVLAAVQAQDAAALKALAAKGDPDPWLVADELIRRDQHDAADTFARAAPRMDVARLLDYVASRRGKPDDAAARASLAAATAALEAKQPAKALEVLGPADAGPPADVTRIRRAVRRGQALAALGRLEEGAAALVVAADGAERLGWPALTASALHESGVSALRRSDYRGGLAALERSLKISDERGDRSGASKTLANIGIAHRLLGNYPRALEYQERTLKMKEELGDRASVAGTLINIGNVHASLGNNAKALEYCERGLAEAEAAGERRWSANALLSLGIVHHSLGIYPKALEYFERALKGMEDLGDRAGAAWTLCSIGMLAREAGDLPKATSSLQRAVREAERLRADPTLARALRELAESELAAGDPRGAVRTAKRAIPLLERMLGGLGEGQGAEARGKHSNLFGAGALAAARSDDAAEASFFLESGRAGSLMESLSGRQALRWQAVPEDLRMADAEARAAESIALAGYTKALDRGEFPESRAALAALDAARSRVSEVVERIQRLAKKDARLDLFYPRAATLEEIGGWLGKGEALVLYGLCLDEALAVVITDADAKVVALGKAADVTAACEALDLADPTADPAAALARIRALLVAPLALRDDVKRVLVSPEGPLSYVPMAALLPGREVACEPSGTTYGLLLEDRARRGKRVLALGDPDYTAEFNPKALALYAPSAAAAAGPTRGARLAPLPGTRSEAQAIGDVVLLGREASEAGLRASIAQQKERWHAVHFACHAIVDPERPALSSLALTPDAENDGFLTALEVLRMEIPSDLVVLSACETGQGKIIDGEGIVGLTRAFMYAGSPRVICSLWKVDDEATRALMTEFYRLWNPKDGGPGLPTAEALRRAQELVRSKEKWAHPYYWAAWVLWGLPE